MNTSFGIHSRSTSTRWVDIRRGPSAEAVRSHLLRIANFNGRATRTTTGR